VSEHWHRGAVRPTHPGQHLPETPAMDLLDDVLERYEVTPITRDEEQQALEATEQFLTAFREVRETVLRRGLEEAAWRLDQRGHHAWVDEETADGPHPDARDAITLSLVPIGYVAGDAEASSMTFVADSSSEHVEVYEHIGGSTHEDHAIGRYTIEQMDYVTVGLLAAELVRRAFTAYPPLPTKEATDPSIAHD
jgi:hypothetical protein